MSIHPETLSALQALLLEEKRRLFQPLAAYLAERYEKGEALEVARLCDERLDRSGNLLGWVREEAGKLRNRKSSTENHS